MFHNRENFACCGCRELSLPPKAKIDNLCSAFINELKKHGIFFHCVRKLVDIKDFSRKIIYVSSLMEKYYGDKLTNLYEELKNIKTQKCNSKATQFREMGNKLFRKGKWDNSLYFYNKSICFSIPESETIIMAYGNRTAVLFEMGKYKECLEQIKIIKEFNIKPELLTRLEDRGKRCSMKLKEIRHDNEQIENEKLSYPANPKNPNIIKYLSIRKNDQNHLEIYTRKQLSPGDVIAIENPFVLYIPEGLTYRKCSYCASDRLERFLISCPGCTCAIFCNEICQRKAYEEYHKFECDIYEIIKDVFKLDYLMGAKRILFTGLNIFGTPEKFLAEIKTKAGNLNFLKLSKDKISIDRESSFTTAFLIKGFMKLPDDTEQFPILVILCFLMNFIFRFTKFKETLKNPKEKEIFLELLVYVFRLNFSLINEGINTASPVFNLATRSKHANMGIKVENGKSLIVVTETIKKNESLTVQKVYEEEEEGDEDIVDILNILRLGAAMEMAERRTRVHFPFFPPDLNPHNSFFPFF